MMMRRPIGIRGVIPDMSATRDSMPQVMVRVVPRLLGDTLSLVLQARRLAVSTCPAHERRAHPRTPRHFDLAIVTADLPVDIRADRVIVVDEDGRPTAAVGQLPAVRSGGDGDLVALLALIDDLLT